MTNSFIEAYPDQPGSSLISLNISIADILDRKFSANEETSTDYLDSDNIIKIDNLTLPSGQIIPGISKEEVPSLAYKLKKFGNISLYFGTNMIGIFLPVELDFEDKTISLPFYMGQDEIGVISMVGNDERGENSGSFLLVKFKDKMLEQLRNNYK